MTRLVNSFPKKQLEITRTKYVVRDVLFEYHRVVVPFVEQFDQLEVCLPNRRLLTGIPTLAVFQNLRWNSNKTSLQH